MGETGARGHVRGSTERLLFDEVERRPGAIEFRETTFEWLERSADEEDKLRRGWIESWFAELPDHVRPQFKARLTTRELPDFMAALFEMQVHSLLRRLGCSVGIEPPIPGTENRIDFLARDGDRQFYLEVAVCGLGKSELRSNDAEYDAVRKIREQFPSPHSHLWLETTGELKKWLRKGHVVEPFRSLLRRHTPEQVRRRHAEGGLSNAPCAQLAEGDWILKGCLDPVSDGSTGHVCGPARTGMVDGSQALREKLSDKARKWRNVDLGGRPCLIALNDCSRLHRRDREITLFGRTGRDGSPSQSLRRSFSRVDGVLVASNAVLGNELDAEVRLYRNPRGNVPACLDHLERPHTLAVLLGIDRRPS